MKHASELVNVHKVYNSVEAELIRSQLEAEGIVNFLKADDLAPFFVPIKT